jgi:1,4-dihydroxy-2-naphthoate octaprenyltransferase
MVFVILNIICKSLNQTWVLWYMLIVYIICVLYMARDVPLINNLLGSIFLVVFFEFVVIKEIENYLSIMKYYRLKREGD